MQFDNGALMKCKSCAGEFYVQHTPMPACPHCGYEHSYWLAYYPMNGQRGKELPH